MLFGIRRSFYYLVLLSVLALLVFLEFFFKKDVLKEGSVFSHEKSAGSDNRVERSNSLIISLLPYLKTMTAAWTTSVAKESETSAHATKSSKRLTTSSIYNSTATSKKELDFSEEGNKRCLEYLLEQQIVQYYYPPLNDDDNLNFSVKGIVASVKLGPNFPNPLLVLKEKPPPFYVSLPVPRQSCSRALLNFLPTLTAEDYEIFRYILKFFKHVANLANMAYYLNYGSLLGHVRFSGQPTPWDDDIDITIDYAKLRTFKQICKRETQKIKTLNQETEFFRPSFSVSRDRIKLFDSSHPKIREFKHSFPFVDLFFFNTEVEDLYDLPEDLLITHTFSDAFHSSYIHSIPIETMLPFRRERFLGLDISVPARPKDLLKELNYVSSDCRVVSYSHRYEKILRTRRVVPCKDLVGFYDVSAVN